MNYSTPDYSTIEIYLKAHLKNKEELNELQKSSVTPNYQPMPSGHGENRTTENLAVRQLEPYKQKWFDAIEQAFESLKTSPFYGEIVELITLMYFMDYLGEHEEKYFGLHNIGLERAAEQMHIAPITASRRKKMFFQRCWDIRRHE